jgi:deoxynucleoside kinase
MIISFDSNIGGGKSTQLSRLQRKRDERYDMNMEIWMEELNEWIREGWLDSFYKDMSKYAFSFQMRVFYSQVQRYNNYKNRIKNSGSGGSESSIILTERSPFTCHNIFGDMLVRDGYMSNIEMDLCNKYQQEVGWNPNYGIYIRTDPEVCQERIQSRDRKQESTIPYQYLIDLHEQHERSLLNQDIFEVRVVNGNRDVEEIGIEIDEIIERWQHKHMGPNMSNS